MEKAMRWKKMYLIGVINSFNCILREEPSASSRCITRLDFGRQTILEEDIGQWCRVWLPSGIQGWVEKRELGIFKIWEPKE